MSKRRKMHAVDVDRTSAALSIIAFMCGLRRELSGGFTLAREFVTCRNCERAYDAREKRAKR